MRASHRTPCDEREEAELPAEFLPAIQESVWRVLLDCTLDGQAAEHLSGALTCKGAAPNSTALKVAMRASEASSWHLSRLTCNGRSLHSDVLIATCYRRRSEDVRCHGLIALMQVLLTLLCRSEANCLQKRSACIATVAVHCRSFHPQMKRKSGLGIKPGRRFKGFEQSTACL